MGKRIVFQWKDVAPDESGYGPDDVARVSHAKVWAPNTDLCEGPQGFLIRMELAGVRREDVRIYTAGNQLIVQGERTDEPCSRTLEERRFHQLEIEHGPFERRIVLPACADASRATARLAHGLLEIRLPHAERPQTKTIRLSLEP